MERKDMEQWAVPDKGLYEEYMEREGIPIYRNVAGVSDVTELPRRPWARTGGLGTFVQLTGMIDSERGVYVGEIPAGGALNPEKHFYEEAFIILKGVGGTEVWQEGGPKVTFEWGEGSLFAPPLNTWHRLFNGSQEPALFLAITTAPVMMDHIRDQEFIFNCDYKFMNHFSGQKDFFTPAKKWYKRGKWTTIWPTNFIPNVHDVFMREWPHKVSGGMGVGYRMASGFPLGHISQWPVGRYHKAHYHGPGALILGLRGKGYVPLWPHEFGIHPYQDGHEDKVVIVEWGPRSIYSPPAGWFHQHLNTSKEPARNVAIYGLSVQVTRNNLWREGKKASKDTPAIMQTSVGEGGTLIEYEDEDPEIRRRFEETLRKEGVKCQMPPVIYRQ